jgi:CRISPR-associated protein Csb1
MTTISLARIAAAQALRSVLTLEPIDGPGGRIYPPTYPGAKDGDPPRHVVETLPNGSKRVLLDSVASQANRQEQALIAARNAGRINFSDVYIDLRDTDAGIAVLSATEMPHRLSDAILRDSVIDGIAFKNTSLGKAIVSVTPANLSALLEASPTTVLYGCWFSGFGIPNPLRLQRCVVADMWAENVVQGQHVASRTCPLGIEKIDLYQTTDGNWTALTEEAARDAKDKPRPFGKRPSELKHGNIIDDINVRGVTAEKIVLRWALPLAAVRRLRFGGDKRDAAGQAYVVALALVARTLQHEAGYSLRSRCDLISKGRLTIDVVEHDGSIDTPEIDAERAIALLKEAEATMKRAGLKIHQRFDVKASSQLKGLIAANRSYQMARGEVAA